jgi:hypothetical protein
VALQKGSKRRLRAAAESRFLGKSQMAKRTALFLFWTHPVTSATSRDGPSKRFAMLAARCVGIEDLNNERPSL